jgi:hypothetical protein
MSQKNTNRIKINPVICARCGKLFLCKGRINLVLGRTPLPFSRNDCLTKTYCECDDCHPPNKKDRVCANVSFTFMLNPSRRKLELNFLEIFEEKEQ